MKINVKHKKNTYFLIRIIFIFFLLLIFNIVINQNISSAIEDEENKNIDSKKDIIEKQEESFGISSFLKNAKEYSSDEFKSLDFQNILNDAIKGNINNSKIFKIILNILRKRIKGKHKIGYFNSINNYYT